MKSWYRILLPQVDLFVSRRQEEVSENKLKPLDEFSVAELGSPADFCLAAEILGLPLQELQRSKCSLFYHLSNSA